MKNEIFYWVIGVIFLLLPFTGSAYWFDQSQTRFGGSFSAVSFAPVGQSFVLQQEFILGVMLKLSDAGGAGMGNWAEVRLRKDRIDGEVVAVSEEFYLEDCFNFIADPGCGLGGGNPAQITFLFQQPVRLEVGNIYVMELVVDPMGDGLLVAYHPGDVYPHGGYHMLGMPSVEDLWFCTLAPGSPEIPASSPEIDSHYEWIQSVSLNGTLVTSGDNQGYVKHEQLILNITADQPNTLLLTPGFRGGRYSEYWSVWVDWNRDGQFSDQEKMVSSRSDAALLTTFDVPPGTVTGLRRMRIAMRFDAPPINCGEFYYGEVEDFVVRVVE